MKNLRNYEIINKKVLFRADLNVPVLNEVITDTSRILAIKSSIKYLISNKNKICNIVDVAENQTGNLSVKMNPFWSLENSGHLSEEGSQGLTCSEQSF